MLTKPHTPVTATAVARTEEEKLELEHANERRVVRQQRVRYLRRPDNDSRDGLPNMRELGAKLVDIDEMINL